MAAAPPLEPSLRRRLGARIKAVREEVFPGSLGQAALLAEFDKSGLSRWESGETTPSLGTLFKLAKELGVLVMDLVAIETDHPRVRALDAIRRGDEAELAAALRAHGWSVADGALHAPVGKPR